MAALSLTCKQCNAQLKSVKEAQDHGEVTGHSQFEESTEPVRIDPYKNISGKACFDLFWCSRCSTCSAPSVVSLAVHALKRTYTSKGQDMQNLQTRQELPHSAIHGST